MRAWRKHRGLTLQELADATGIHKGALSRLEREDRDYHGSHLDLLAKALDCTPADLISRAPEAAESIVQIWDRIKPAQRDTARRILEQIADPKKDRAG